MKPMNVKGTYDYLPQDMKIRNEIIQVIQKNLERYGYLPLETPIINYYDLLNYKYQSDAEILKEIYRLSDQGNRDLGLRYDLTVPFCKVISLTKELSFPFKRYEIGKVFRNGPVKPGRTREFIQCDADVVGIDNRFIEVEQILMAINTYQELGIDVIVKYNNRKLMTAMILESEIPPDKLDSVILIIDKLEKSTHQEIISMLKELSLSEKMIDKLFTFFEKKLSELPSLTFTNLETNKLFQEGLSELEEFMTYLEYLNIQDKTIFTPTLARGLSIYTGIVFEFYDKLQRVKSSIGGGGRYNQIITNFIHDGKSYPACGLSFGLEPIFVILKETSQTNHLLDIYIVPLGDKKVEVEALKLAETLRKMGYQVLVEMNQRKVSKSFEYAEKKKIKYVMILGEDEISQKKYKIKDMDQKEEYTYQIDELKSYLTRNFPKMN